MDDFGRARVLVVEDDEDIARRSSARCAWRATRCASPATARRRSSEARAFAPDLVILDLGLPKLDGIEVARALRDDDDVPILMLTARDALESRVEGLDAGADDYLVKPFERQELLARMRALLRRRPPRGSAPLRVGDLPLNADTHEVRRGERAVELTQREFELLEYLMRNERIVISRQRLLDEVWGYDPFSTTNTIEVFVSNLRRKLEADGEPRLLHTIRGAATSFARPSRGDATRVIAASPPADPRGASRASRRADVRDPVRVRGRDRLAHVAPDPLGLQPPGRATRPTQLRAQRIDVDPASRPRPTIRRRLDVYAAPTNAVDPDRRRSTARVRRQTPRARPTSAPPARGARTDRTATAWSAAR